MKEFSLSEQQKPGEPWCFFPGCRYKTVKLISLNHERPSWNVWFCLSTSDHHTCQLVRLKLCARLMLTETGWNLRPALYLTNSENIRDSSSNQIHQSPQDGLLSAVRGNKKQSYRLWNISDMQKDAGSLQRQTHTLSLLILESPFTSSVFIPPAQQRRKYWKHWKRLKRRRPEVTLKKRCITNTMSLLYLEEQLRQKVSRLWGGRRRSAQETKLKWLLQQTCHQISTAFPLKDTSGHRWRLKYIHHHQVFYNKAGMRPLFTHIRPHHLSFTHKTQSVQKILEHSLNIEG